MYQKPILSYSYDALMPYYNSETLQIHEKLHQGYVDNYNKTVNNLSYLRQNQDFKGIKNIMQDLAFYGSGAVLHTLFFENLIPNKDQILPNQIHDLLIKNFGSFENFKKEFSAAATTIQGNGWAIFGYNPILNEFLILTARNHENLTIWDYEPILVVDIWEHSYFLKYQSEKEKYMENMWNIINWEVVNKRYLELKNK